MTNENPKKLIKARQQKIADFGDRLFKDAVQKNGQKQSAEVQTTESELEKLKKEISALKSENFIHHQEL